jgi:hypothetical protein
MLDNYTVNLETGCWEWAGRLLKTGYGYIYYEKRDARAHRVAYCVHHGLDLYDIRDEVVMHLCHNRPCINPDHLKLGSHRDNVMSSLQDDRIFGGNKLTASDVEQIDGYLRAGYQVKEVAEMYGVAPTTVSAINTGRTWSWLTKR